MDAQVNERISKMIKGETVFLFMKGNPTFPQCGFSNQVVQILKEFKVPFGHFDVLSDMEVREGIKVFSDWPTIPQLYLEGELIGGCDIVRELWQSGELEQQLKAALPDQDVAAPKPPAKPENITPAQAKEMLEKGEARFLDVRSPQECAIVKVEGFEMLDQDLAQEILDNEEPEKTLVFMCHFGGRSAGACEFFSQRGFQKVCNVVGGIDSWAQTVDSGLARY